MTSSRDSIKSLKDLPREDLEAVSNVQNYLVGVTMGQQPFEHPNAPRVAPGSRYMPNQTETDFAQKSRSTLMTNFIRHVAVGALTPYVALRGLSVLQKRVIPTTRYMIWTSLGGGFGGMYGLTVGRFVVAIDYIKLEHSPLATEARFQLWKLRPHHPYLNGFEHETSEWEEYRYRDSRDTFQDDQRRDYGNEYRDDRGNQNRQNDDYYNFTDRRSNPMKPPPPPLLETGSRRYIRGPLHERNQDANRQDRSYSDYRNDSNRGSDDRNDEVSRRKKRDRFYGGRNRVDNNSLDDDMGGYDDIGEFFDSSPSGPNKYGNDRDNDFFEGTDSQKWE